MPRSPFWFTVVLVLVGLFLLRESRRADGALAEVDGRFLDWLMANAGSPARDAGAPPLGVTLVEIDDAVVADRLGGAARPTGEALPLGALDYALFLQAAETLGPAVVGVEPVLLWPRDRQQPEYERILLNQALRTPKLLLGAHSAADAGGKLAALEASGAIRPQTALTQRPLSPLAAPGQALPTAAANVILPGFRHVRGDPTGLPELSDLARRPAERLLLTATPGPTDLPPPDAGSGGLTRTVPLLFRCQGEVLPSFVLQAVMLDLQLTPEEVQVDLGRFVQMGRRVRIPINEAGALRVDFPTARRIPRLSLDDWLLAATSLGATGSGSDGDGGGGGGGKEGGNPRPAPPGLRGGVALFGRTDAVSRTLRLPTGQAGSPVELFAAGVATVSARAFIQRVPVAYDGLVIGALTVLGWAFLPLRRPVGVALTAAFGLVYTLIALTVFELGRLWLPWALPAGILLTMAVLLAATTPGGGPPEAQP